MDPSTHKDHLFKYDCRYDLQLVKEVLRFFAPVLSWRGFVCLRLCVPSLRLVCVFPFGCVLRFRFLLCFLVRFLVF